MRCAFGNGPNGDSLDDVKKLETVIASADAIAADAFAATLLGMTGNDIPYVRMRAEMELGEINLNRVKIEQL